MNVIGVIPSRYDSTRFPGKPLVDIAGQSMIQRVYERCVRCGALDRIIVATDDQRIFDAVEAFGGQVKMTRSDHISGTARVAEVAADFDSEDVIINIQGDEPLIDPRQVSAVVDLIINEKADIGTLARIIDDPADIQNPNVVKVVTAFNNDALYFSRSPIPYNRSNSNILYKQHIGIYGFRNDVLQKLVQLNASKLEISESLEQLRWLEQGYKIQVGITEIASMGVDVPEDVERIVKLLN